MPSEEQTHREFVKHMLTDIKEQTTKTNGRVTALEDRQDKADLRGAYIQGALAVIGVLMTTLIIPLAFMAIQYALKR